ncbi:hypothetical protein DL93DRAFT_2159033 [Clavulina sp. PMI_390]|nr:hypothetical protein DL93DRAFT_2159033 [Clavulina sp. PMI_390]
MILLPVPVPWAIPHMQYEDEGSKEFGFGEARFHSKFPIAYYPSSCGWSSADQSTLAARLMSKHGKARCWDDREDLGYDGLGDQLDSVEYDTCRVIKLLVKFRHNGSVLMNCWLLSPSNHLCVVIVHAEMACYPERPSQRAPAASGRHQGAGRGAFGGEKRQK